MNVYVSIWTQHISFSLIWVRIHICVCVYLCLFIIHACLFVNSYLSLITQEKIYVINPIKTIFQFAWIRRKKRLKSPLEHSQTSCWLDVNWTDVPYWLAELYIRALVLLLSITARWVLQPWLFLSSKDLPFTSLVSFFSNSSLQVTG